MPPAPTNPATPGAGATGETAAAAAVAAARAGSWRLAGAGWPLMPWALIAAGAALVAALGLVPVVLIAGIMLLATALALAGEALLFLWIVVAVSGLGIGWADLGVLGLGGHTINLNGLRWGLLALASGALLLRPSPRRRIPRLFLPYLVFLAVAALAVAWAPNRFEGIKNLVQYAAPLLIALAAYRSVRTSHEVELLTRAFWWALGVGIPVMVAWTVLAPLAGVTLPQGYGLEHRGFAMWLLPGYGLALAAWRMRGGAWLGLAAALFALAVLTLARTTVGAMLLLGLVSLLVRPARLSPGPVLLLGLLALGALQYEPLRERLFEDPRVGLTSRLITITGSGDDIRLSIAGLNLTGRGMVWARTFLHAAERPMLGHGTGSASDFLNRELSGAIVHPHNDYLRIFHDLGVLGLVPVLCFGATALLALRRRWRTAPSPLARQLALAALLATWAWLAVPVFDNSMVYVTFFTQNIFLLIALALRACELEAAGEPAPEMALAGGAAEEEA